MMGFLDLLRSSSREPSSATLMARGVTALVVLTTAVTSLYLYGKGTFSDTWKVAAIVDTAGGSLVVDSDVKYDGVVVGRVAGLEFDGASGKPDGTRIDLSLRPNMAEGVPAGVTARVLPASVFGTSFVDLVPPKQKTGSLKPGALIAQDRSRSTLELQTVLDGLDEVIDALGPAELSRTLTGLSGALDGNGAKLGRTIERLQQYLTKLNPQMPTVRRNLDLLATNLEAFEGYAPDLFAATDNALVAAHTLIEQEDDLRGLTKSGAATMTDVNRLLTDNEQRLVDLLVRTAVTVDSLYDGRKGFSRGLLSVLDLGEGFRSALSNGRYLRIDGQLVLSQQGSYGRGDCPQYGTARGRGC